MRKRIRSIARNPYFWLVTTLSGLALISLAIIWPPSIRDLLTNFTVDVVGVLITVLFVDWIISRRENQRWAAAKAYIRGDFAGTTIEFLVRAALLLKKAGWEGHTVSESNTNERKPIAFELEHITLVDIRSALDKADETRLEEFASEVLAVKERIAKQHERFSSRLNADETDLILRLETTLEGVKKEFGLIGPDSDLPILIEDESQLVDAYEKHLQEASSSLKEAISQSLELVEFAFRYP